GRRCDHALPLSESPAFAYRMLNDPTVKRPVSDAPATKAVHVSIRTRSIFLLVLIGVYAVLKVHFFSFENEYGKSALLTPRFLFGVLLILKFTFAPFMRSSCVR